MSFRRVWSQFHRHGVTLGPTPGVREAWHQGRRWYHVWVLTLDDPAVHARCATVHAALSSWLGPMPNRLHVTVWVHGFDPPPPYPEGQQVDVEVGRINSFTSCAFLEVRSPALPLVRRLFDGPEERWSAYRPHLTVGCYTSRFATRDLPFAPWRQLPALRTTGTLRHLCVDAFTSALVEPI